MLDPQIALQKLLDIQEITEVLYRYARGVDRRDSELIRRCFHSDAFDDHGSVSGSVDELMTAIENFSARYDLTFHFIGNVLIEVEGDLARSEAYAVATHRRDPQPGRDGKDDIWGIRYVDRFEQRKGEWRIAYRVITHEWRTVVPIPEGRVRGATAGLWGRHDIEDPLRWILHRAIPGRSPE
jgi:hypothetical protein